MEDIEFTNKKNVKKPENFVKSLKSYRGWHTPFFGQSKVSQEFSVFMIKVTN